MSTYTFSAGSQALAQGPMTQLALLHYDNSLTSTSGVAPAQSTGVSFAAGKFGQAVTLAANGTLAYPQGGNLSFQDGTIEMWVSPRYDGSNALYVTAPQVVFQYFWGANGDQLVLAEGTSGGGPYFFGGAAGIYAGAAAAAGISGISGWKVGEWHHLAFTYSVSQSRVRLYVDGQLAQEGDGAINFPSNPSADFTIAGDSFGHASNFAVDEVRITNNEMAAAEIAFDAARSTPFANDEVFLSLAGVNPGQLNYSVTGCGSATYNFTGVPITNFSPPSGLIPPGSSSVALVFNTLQATSCRYSLGTALDFNSMLPLDAGPPVLAHSVSVTGLSSDPRVTNQVYIRCASNQDFLQSAAYRTVATPTGQFPHIGSIWWGSYIYSAAPQQAQKIQLFLGPGFSVAQAQAIRAANPNVLILPAVSAEEAPTGETGAGTPAPPVPDSYYMKDINGNRIETYPGLYMLNMTIPQVAEFVAQYAYQLITQSNLAFDGIFFDNFQLTISGFTTDALGNPVQIDANGDGQPDNPAVLDAAWAAGELHMIDTLRNLLPYGYVSAHLSPLWPIPASVFSAFNGNSLNKGAIQTKEGLMPFSDLWNAYQSWFSAGVSPSINMVQSSPPGQIANGYGDFPLNGTPPPILPATVEFGQTYYPSMRFGLSLALMNDGYFTHDFGDVTAPVSWWYDEYDFSLGSPTGAATQLASGGPEGPDLLVNGGFESGLQGWTLYVFNNNKGPGVAAAAVDNFTVAQGNSSAQITVSSVAANSYDIQFQQGGISLSGGTIYQLQFWARADVTRSISVFCKGVPGTFYGLSQQFSLGTSWQLYSASFTAAENATDGIIEFSVGDVAGSVWLDGVTLSVAPLATYRRDFTNGVVLLNGTQSPQNISLESGLHRFSGTQAPKYQYIIDDGDGSFISSGAWNVATYDSGGIWNGSSLTQAVAQGPYYHAWKRTLHQLDGASGTAQWNLGITEDGQYTLQVWLPAAPNASSWTPNAIYEVVSNGNVVFSASLDQTTAAAGDGWHTIATNLNLTVAGAPFIRVHNGASGSLVADAVYVTSVALYNDGSSAPQVTLAPFDGILLQRQTPISAPASRVNSVANAASYQQAIASGGFVSIIGTGFANSARSWTASDFSGNSLPVSLDGVSVTMQWPARLCGVHQLDPDQRRRAGRRDDRTGHGSGDDAPGHKLCRDRAEAETGSCVLHLPIRDNDLRGSSSSGRDIGWSRRPVLAARGSGRGDRDLRHGVWSDQSSGTHGATDFTAGSSDLSRDGDDRRSERTSAVGGNRIVRLVSTQRPTPKCDSWRPAGAGQR